MTPELVLGIRKLTAEDMMDLPQGVIDSTFPLDVVTRFVRRVPHMLAIGMMKVKAALAEDPYNANLGARWERLWSAFQKYPLIDTKEDE